MKPPFQTRSHLRFSTNKTTVCSVFMFVSTMIEGTSTSHQAMTDIPQIVPFDPTKKKKKKKVSIQRHWDESPHSSMERDDMLSNNHEKDVEEDLHVQQSRYRWKESEHGYDYKELLQRVFGFLRESNPELAGDKQRTVLKPPQVFPEGTTKTVFANFMDLCKLMHREPEHVMTFMLTELCTSGSLDGDNRLVFQGRFSLSSLERVLQAYINEYVLCHICRFPDTNLVKVNLAFFLQCDLCGSERPVTSIGADYGTLVERRKSRQNLGSESL